jgi:glycosyltransferase involved in cell wall biosynthesis
MTVAYIVRSFPRLSQTFILNEILALEQIGVRIEIFGMTDPAEPIVQPGVHEVRAWPRYLDRARRRSWIRIAAEHLRYAVSSPRRYSATAGYVLRRRDLDTGYTTASRFACFLDAVYLARAIRSRRADERIVHVHSHFAHDPTLIALLVKMLTGVPYSFTAHARDLYQTPARALVERVNEAKTVVTCCDANRRYLEHTVVGCPDKVRLVHHGIDFRALRVVPQETAPKVPLILSAGRLVPKKGFADLIRACSALQQRQHHFRCLIYGEGPLRGTLLDFIDGLGLTKEIELAGACTQAHFLDELRRASIFVLTPIVADDGDRDGIPNVIVEAMACGLPVASTAAGGVPEVVIHGDTGLLAGPGDVAGIAGNLEALLADASLRRRLGARARDAVSTDFDVRANARRLVEIFATEEGPS